jgi:hypothetical protein
MRGGALTAKASNDLKQAWPALSAAPPRWHANKAPLALAACIITAAVVFAPVFVTHAAELMLAAVFIAWLTLRVGSAFIF